MLSPTGWTFAVLTFRTIFTDGSTIKREPYGVFTSKDDCDIARAKKIAFLDDGDYRQPHLLPDAPVIITTTTTGPHRAPNRSLRNNPAVRPKR